jgi:hypothetical protein
MKKILKTASVLATIVLTNGCQNGITHSVCAGKSANLEGISGSYEVSFQKDDFTIETLKTKIDMDERSGKVKTITFLGQREEELEATLCTIGGVHIAERFDTKSATYNLVRLNVSNVGLQFSPLMFDKAALDAAGVKNQIIEVPNALKHFGLSLLSFNDSETSSYLVVENSELTAEETLRFTKVSPASITYIRK